MTQKKVLRFLAALVVILAAAYYWLFVSSPAPAASGFTIDLERLRQLASSMPGERPTEIRVEHVMDFVAPEMATISVGSPARTTMWGVAYQLVYPDGHTAILDTAMDEAQAKALGTVSNFDPAAYQRMITAMDRASWIAITHEHPDHIGGLASHPRATQLFAKSVKLTREQLDNRKPMLPVKLDEASIKGYQPLAYEQMFALAPGVALEKAPGHTPGSQLVFVVKSDGTEILFLGDVAWRMRNVELERGRPKLIELMVGEDRSAVLAELRAIHALASANQKLRIIAGHDQGNVEEMTSGGVLKTKFLE